MRYDQAEWLKALGMRVKEFRKQRGWTVRDMILTHGYHQTAYARIERGDGMTIGTLLRLCEVFDVSLSELLDGLALAPINNAGVEKVLKGGKSVRPKTARKSAVRP